MSKRQSIIVSWKMQGTNVNENISRISRPTESWSLETWTCSIFHEEKQKVFMWWCPWGARKHFWLQVQYFPLFFLIWILECSKLFQVTSCPCFRTCWLNFSTSNFKHHERHASTSQSTTAAGVWWCEKWDGNFFSWWHQHGQLKNFNSHPKASLHPHTFSH